MSGVTCPFFLLLIARGTPLSSRSPSLLLRSFHYKSSRLRLPMTMPRAKFATAQREIARAEGITFNNTAAAAAAAANHSLYPRPIRPRSGDHAGGAPHMHSGPSPSPCPLSPSQQIGGMTRGSLENTSHPGSGTAPRLSSTHPQLQLRPLTLSPSPLAVQQMPTPTLTFQPAAYAHGSGADAGFGGAPGMSSVPALAVGLRFEVGNGSISVQALGAGSDAIADDRDRMTPAERAVLLQEARTRALMSR